MIPDETVGRWLGALFGSSSPGDALHQLLIAAAPRARTALGLPNLDDLKLSMYAIAPDKTVNTNKFIADVISQAMAEAAQNRAVIHFAGLAIEAHAAAPDDTTRDLIRKRRLQDHPQAYEVTVLYAAASDGRRWTGVHTLTGPNAGQVDGPTVIVGPVTHAELGTHPICRPLILAAVGLGVAAC